MLVRAPDGFCAETDEQAVDLIFAYWEDFWKRASDNQPGLDDRVASLLSSYPCQEACLWEFPTGVQLSAVARASKGSAGPDGWSGDELRHMPVQAFEVFATLAGRWLEAGVAPNQMLESRMVCLPKPGKVRASDNTVSVEHTRPITVLSCWWRLFASCWVKSRPVVDWIRAHLPMELVVPHRRSTGETLVDLFDKFQRLFGVT